MSAYEGLAQYYDSLTADVEYERWLSWYQDWFRKSEQPVQLVLDLACGTGTLTRMLAEAGYSMIGVDRSAEMLAEAMEKSMEAGNALEMPLFLNQSMERLELMGQVDACVSSLDSVNYVTDQDALQEAFRRVNAYLTPGGYFLFDILPPEWMRSLDGETFIDETEDVFCVWRADFDRETQVLTYGMDLFEREGGHWLREQEEHSERAWEPSLLREMLEQAGFEQVEIFGPLVHRPAQAGDRRLCFVCRSGT